MRVYLTDPVGEGDRSISPLRSLEEPVLWGLRLDDKFPSTEFAFESSRWDASDAEISSESRLRLAGGGSAD